jgi:predicted metalloprotease with PDZ domain
MKNNILLKFILVPVSSLFIFGCAALRTTPKEVTSLQASVDLINIVDDKVQIHIQPATIKTNEIVFYIPQIVPGTYEYSNFGKFVEDFKALDVKGNKLPIEVLDQNSWKISDAQKLDRVTYWVNDTFDGPGGEKVYPMGGTNFNAGKTHLLNLHSMIGYFEGMQENSYRLTVRSPQELQAFTSLPMLSKSDTLDVFNAERYFHIIDNPILYSKPNAVSFQLDDIKVGLAIYSPTDTHQAKDYQAAIQEMMIAQKKFLGDANQTKSYDILLHLMEMEELQYFGGMMGALEHHTSTTVVFLDAMPAQELSQSLVDVVSHEFFHTLTPLNIHSEEIHNFEYNTPLMSKHLWMYEGTTEYFANLFQINQGLIDASDFYNRMMEKVNFSKRYDDTLSFTKMSAGIVEEPYQSNYGNVYQKGALINMCLDLIIREQSGGEKGILSVMKQLAQRYGTEKPFQDEALIDEIVAMTYPEVGVFFKKHVEGTTPIDYMDYFSKVGLTMGEKQAPLPGILFQDTQSPIFRPQPNAEGTVQYVISGLNSTLEKLGVQLGDVFIGLDGKELPEIKQENAEAINAVFAPSFMWSADTEFTIKIKREGEVQVLSGKVGTPSAVITGLIEDDKASEVAQELRKAWLYN